MIQVATDNTERVLLSETSRPAAERMIGSSTT